MPIDTQIARTLAEKLTAFYASLSEAEADALEQALRDAAAEDTSGYAAEPNAVTVARILRRLQGA